jgi:hypothetical protein
MRDDFKRIVKDALARRAGMRCSNPKCRKPTSGPQEDGKAAINIGVAAHITAASSGGPRYNPVLNNEQRASIENAIWLCQNCAKLVDSDKNSYTVDILRRWKRQAEDTAKQELESNEIHLPTQIQVKFTTQKVIRIAGGFAVQFCLSSMGSEEQGQISIYSIMPVVITRHYLKTYMRMQPIELSTIVLNNLHNLKRIQQGRLLGSEGLFSVELIGDDVYLLNPGDIETFRVAFIVNTAAEMIWFIGFRVEYSNYAGDLCSCVSDAIFAINAFEQTLWSYNINALKQRLNEIEGYSPEKEDIKIVGFEVEGLRHIPLKRIQCNWEHIFKECIAFLEMKEKGLHDMEPV